MEGSRQHQKNEAKNNDGKPARQNGIQLDGGYRVEKPEEEEVSHTLRSLAEEFAESSIGQARGQTRRGQQLHIADHVVGPYTEIETDLVHGSLGPVQIIWAGPQEADPGVLVQPFNREQGPQSTVEPNKIDDWPYHNPTHKKLSI